MKFKIIKTILLSLWMTSAFAAPASIQCQRGQGLWLTSEGQVVCRPCPEDVHFQSSRSLKLPEGCLARSHGVYLPMGLYTHLRTAEALSDQLLEFQQSLEPALFQLQTDLQTAAERLNLSKETTARLSNENSQLRERVSSLSTQRLWLAYITAGLSVSTVTTILLLSI